MRALSVRQHFYLTVFSSASVIICSAAFYYALSEIVAELRDSREYVRRFCTLDSKTELEGTCVRFYARYGPGPSAKNMSNNVFPVMDMKKCNIKGKEAAAEALEAVREKNRRGFECFVKEVHSGQKSEIAFVRREVAENQKKPMLSGGARVNFFVRTGLAAAFSALFVIMGVSLCVIAAVHLRGGEVVEAGGEMMVVAQPAKVLSEVQVDLLLGKLEEEVTGEGEVESDVCSICLEERGESDDGEENKRVLLPLCKHAYHLPCIKSWIVSGREECPVCRQNILGVP